MNPLSKILSRKLGVTVATILTVVLQIDDPVRAGVAGAVAIAYPHRINPLTTGPGLPRFIDGSRTLKGDGNFPYVAERRGVIFIERSLKQGMEFARHKAHTEALRAQVRRTITAFLLAQMNNGAFSSKEPAKAFFVDVSEQLNPPSVVFSGRLIARVGLATNKPAEFVLLRISADTRALEAELAAAGQ